IRQQAERDGVRERAMRAVRGIPAMAAGSGQAVCGGPRLVALNRGARRIYVASSWRCPWHQEVVYALRVAGHEVYDFRNPRPGEHGFAWSQIEPDWQEWNARRFRAALDHPVAQAGFASDFDALKWCDT